MNTILVRTQSDFCRFVRELTEHAGSPKRTLEEYLRALLLLVRANKDAQVSFALLAHFLSEARMSPIAPFDDQWLSYENPAPEVGQNPPYEDPFGFLERMLLYQIADLHRMRAEGILDLPPHVLYMGVSRKGGETWYNLAPASLLGSAINGLDADSENADCDWSNLAVLLWIGQIYE